MSGAAEVADALAPDVRLDASRADEPRVRVRGREAVLAELTRWWPGEGTLVDWHEDAWPNGAAVTLERIDERGHVRRLRLDLHWLDGQITRIWASSARPRPGAARTPVGMPDEVLARVAPGGRREPLVQTGATGLGLDLVVTRGGERLIAKRVAPGADWVRRATHDPGREALLPYERLPAAVTAVEADPRGGWWVVARDLGATLLPPTGPIAHAAARRILAAAATVHAAFADGPPIAAACSLRDRLALHAPATARAEQGHADLVPKQLEAGWDAFAEVAPPDVAAAVLEAVEEPGPLADRLAAAAPSTLLHGDLRADHVALAPDGGVTLIGWGLACWAPAAFELAWWLLHDGQRVAAARERLLDDFAAAEGERHVPEALDLALVASLVAGGWLLGRRAVIHPDPGERARAREAIDWFAARARCALA